MTLGGEGINLHGATNMKMIPSLKTKERLDRAATNAKWLEIYNNNSVEVLVARSSNHKFILLTTTQVSKSEWRGRSQFIYETSWALEEGCEEVLKGYGVTNQIIEVPCTRYKS